MKPDKIRDNLERIICCATRFKAEFELYHQNKGFKQLYPNLAKYWVDNDYGTLRELMKMIGGYIWKDVV